MKGLADSPSPFNKHLKTGVMGIALKLRAMKGGKHADNHGDENMDEGNVHEHVAHVMDHLERLKEHVHPKHHHHLEKAAKHVEAVGDAGGEKDAQDQEYGD